MRTLEIRGRGQRKGLAFFSMTLALGLVATASWAAPGDLDPTFGTGGIVQVPVPYGNAYDLILQPDGRIVAVGFQDTYIALARFHIDGAADLSFGSDGLVTTNFAAPGGYDAAGGVVLLPDGKIAVGGWVDVFYPQDRVASAQFMVARYNPNGSLDSSFGNGGGTVSGFSPGGWDYGNDLALQPDGKLVLCGAANYTEVPGILWDVVIRSGKFALVRYNSDGSLDTSFGSGGLVTTDFVLDSGGSAAAVAVQPDGKIVAIGSDGYSDHLGGFFDFALARYNPDGSLDGSFGSGGKVLTDFRQWHDFAGDLALQPDGKIVAVGVTGADSGPGAGFTFALARYNPDGSLDAGFGAGGRVITDFPGGTLDQAESVILQGDGKIVVAGGGQQNDTFPRSDFYVLRYLADGSLDPSFGTGGAVMVPQGNWAYSIVPQVDGKLIAAGGGFTLARYLGDEVVAVASESSAPRALSLRVVPNPARGGTAEFVLTGSSGSGIAGVSVDILDPSGRVVRRWDRILEGGSGTPIRWDGTTAAGRRAPSGVYFVRAKLGSEITVGRVIIAD